MYVAHEVKCAEWKQSPLLQHVFQIKVFCALLYLSDDAEVFVSLWDLLSVGRSPTAQTLHRCIPRQCVCATARATCSKSVALTGCPATKQS